MFDKDTFITDFVQAAKDLNESKMNDLAKSVSEESLEFRTQLLEQLVEKLKSEEDVDKEITAGIASVLELMKLAGELEDSTGADGKDENSKPEEATQDVAADTSADKAQETDASEPESGGYAPAEEEKAEKSEA